MLDVDYFKKFNDKHGHEVGDQVLKLVASQLGKVGSGGAAYRYGGEEFCIVFPRRDAEQCSEALERLREDIEAYQLTLRDKQQRPAANRAGSRKRGQMAVRRRPGTVSVTVSLGLAQRTAECSTPEEVLKAADAMLYKAKKAGRNRLMVA